MAGGATAERGDYDGAAEESIRVSSGRSSFTVRIGTNEDADFDDETFYLYVTGEANHPSTTPGASKYRGTGTIRDDDTAREQAIAFQSVGDADLPQKVIRDEFHCDDHSCKHVSDSVTYYYSTYYGTARCIQLRTGRLRWQMRLTESMTC